MKKNFGWIKLFVAFFAMQFACALNAQNTSSSYIEDEPIGYFKYFLTTLIEHNGNVLESRGVRPIEDRTPTIYRYAYVTGLSQKGGNVSSLTVPYTVNYNDSENNTSYAFSVNGISSGALEGEITVCDIILPNKEMDIGDRAFKECVNLRTFTIDDSATSIRGSSLNDGERRASTRSILFFYGNELGESAFQNCRSLYKVRLPKNIQRINDRAFAGCSSLKSIVFTSSFIFHNWSYLQRFASLFIPTGPLGNYVLEGCTGIKDVYVGDAVISVPDEYFDDETFKKAILYVPKGYLDSYRNARVWKNFSEIIEVYEKGKYVYYLKGDKNKKEVLLGKQVEINENVEIPESVTIDDDNYAVKGIAANAFEGCTEMKQVTIHGNITSIGESAFAGCSDLNKIFCYSVTPIDLSSSAVRTRTSKASSVFAGVDKETCVLFVPRGSIDKYREADGWNEFSNIEGIEGDTDVISFADTEVKRICIANWDSNGDGELSVDEAAAVTTLNNAFYQNEDIRTFNELSYFTGLNEIGDYDFTGCKSLSNISLPNGIQSVGYAAFANCFSLQEIEMPQTVESVGEFAFYYCNQLSSVLLPSKLEILNRGAFAACSNLSSISLPASLKSIGEQVFASCVNLKSLSIPANVHTIGIGIVGKCTSLTELEVDCNNPYFYSKGNGIVDKRINMLVQSCKTTEIPTEVVGIADYGFIFVANREEVVIPENVKSIGYDAFQECDDLKRVTIPKAIESISEEAFLHCQNLEQVTMLNPVPIVISKDVFQLMDEEQNNVDFTKATLHVPYGSKEAYEKAPVWKDFPEIVEDGIGVNIGDDDIEIIQDEYIVGNTDYSTGWWSAFSKYYQIPEGQKWKAVFNMNINPAAINTWNNFAVVITNDENRGAADYNEYGAIRFDYEPTGNSEWGNYIDRSLVESTLTFENDTDAGLDKLSGKVTLTIDRTQGGMIVTITNGTVTKTYTQKSHLENLNADATNTTIRAFLVPEGSYIRFLGSSIEPIAQQEIGDVNGDGVVNETDANDVASYILGKTPKGFNKDAADLNGDQKVNAADIVLINNIKKTSD